MQNIWPVVLLAFTLVLRTQARLAQSVEHETLNLRVVGASPTLGANFSQTPHQIFGLKIFMGFL